MIFWTGVFRYVDVVRNEKGELRSWEEYDKLSKGENSLSGSSNYIWNCSEKEREYKDWKDALLDEKRS